MVENIKADKVQHWQTPFSISLMPTDTFQGNRQFASVTGDVEYLNRTAEVLAVGDNVSRCQMRKLSYSAAMAGMTSSTKSCSERISRVWPRSPQAIWQTR